MSSRSRTGLPRAGAVSPFAPVSPFHGLGTIARVCAMVAAAALPAASWAADAELGEITVRSTTDPQALPTVAPGGQVALVWNDRVGGDPLHQALDALFAEFGGAKRSALVAHEERRGVDDFFCAAGFETRQWPHAHALDRDGLLALAFSRSYMPARDTPAGRAATARLDEVFARHAEGGQVQVRYTTVLMRGAPG